MSYTSLNFLLFVAILCGIYYIMRPIKYRWLVLLVGNVIFYAMSGWDNLVFLMVSVVISYYVSLKMWKLQVEMKQEKKQGNYDRKEWKAVKAKYEKRIRRYLRFGLISVIGILAVVKYTNFVLGNVNRLLHAFGLGNDGMVVNLIIPMGISFYTFQMIAYMVDVSNGEEAQSNFLKYALYSSFFPSIVQGPIPRYHDLGHQLFEGHTFDMKNIWNGITMMLWGFAKKLVLAEQLALLVNKIYGNYTAYDGVILVLATVLYSFQIYADFAGCMDIVTGVARLFGIRLKPNFLRPYFSRTMPEFWRRWHASLGTWFKDYVFYPFSISNVSLNINKKSRKLFGNAAGRIIAASMPILIVWSLTGLWHGAEWKYVAWGLFHGCLIILSTIFSPFNDKVRERLKINKDAWWFRLFQILRTFTLCCIGRVFFRAENMGVAIGVFRQTFAATGFWRITGQRFFKHGLDQQSWILVAVLLILLLIAGIIEERSNGKTVTEVICEKPLILRLVVVYVLLAGVLIFGTYGPVDPAANFIYEQF